MTETEPIWHTLAILGPNRWSRRPVLEVYLPQELATRNYPRAERCVTLLRSFLDTGRFTTTHSESVATAYAVLDHLQQVDHSKCTVATALLRVAEWMSAMAGVPVAALLLLAHWPQATIVSAIKYFRWKWKKSYSPFAVSNSLGN